VSAVAVDDAGAIRRPAPRASGSSWAVRLDAIRRVWPVWCCSSSVIGGIYAGAFTRDRSGGNRRRGRAPCSRWRAARSLGTFVEVLIEGVRTTSMLSLILIGALFSRNFINYNHDAFGPEGLRHPVRRCTRSS